VKRDLGHACTYSKCGKEEETLADDVGNQTKEEETLADDVGNQTKEEETLADDVGNQTKVLKNQK